MKTKVYQNTHGVLGLSPELFDLKMLLNPFDKQLYLPCEPVHQVDIMNFSVGNICKLPESSAANQLAEHQNQHMAPMRKRPSFGPVVVLGEDSPGMSLREKQGYLCKNVLSNMHICSDFESDAKVRISKPGQGVGRLKRCA